MKIKDILVHIDQQESSQSRIDVAVKLAQAHDAHISGLYVIPDITIPSYAEVHVPAQLLAGYEQESRATADKTGAHFKQTLDKNGCKGEWICTKGYADQQIRQFARYTDLVILGQTRDNSFLSTYADLPDQVVIGSARPIMFVPYIGVRNTIGKRIMVAWNDSRESVRAVNDALPLLQIADFVDVVAVNPPASMGDIPTADICLHLARHDVKAEASQTSARDIEIGDMLLSRAADLDIDLIVTGAYGHTRLRELILGGVTKKLLEHMTVPVLMSH